MSPAEHDALQRIFVLEIHGRGSREYTGLWRMPVEQEDKTHLVSTKQIVSRETDSGALRQKAICNDHADHDQGDRVCGPGQGKIRKKYKDICKILFDSYTKRTGVRNDGI